MFIHSIQVLRENSFTAKFLLIRLKRTNYQKYQSKWVCGCYNTRKAWAMVLWNEVANAIQIWPKMWFHNKFTQDNKAVIQHYWSSTITLTCLQCKCCANLLQPKQKTLQISKLKWRGKITNENVTEWNKNFWSVL